MPPFRMPFTSKRPTAPVDTAADENARPNSLDGNGNGNVKSPYGRDKPSLALGTKEKKIEPNEFKLSCRRHHDIPFEKILRLTMNSRQR